jgi:hypothetical protein
MAPLEHNPEHTDAPQVRHSEHEALGQRGPQAGGTA